MKIKNKLKSIYTIGHWKRVPVQLHWSALLVLPWYYLSTWKLMEATIATVAYVMLILIHELGHAIVARWRGMRVYSITLYLFHGRCLVEEPYHEKDDIWVSWGGVAAQAAVLAMAMFASYALQTIPIPARELLEPFFSVLISINVLTIIMNLIPMQPLDGYKAWRIVPVLLERLKDRKPSCFSRGRKRLRVISGNKADAKKITDEAIKKMMQK